jgi:hypothetical protein
MSYRQRLKQRKKFEDMSSKDQQDVLVWSHVPYQFRPTEVQENIHLKRYHTPLSNTFGLLGMDEKVSMSSQDDVLSLSPEAVLTSPLESQHRKNQREADMVWCCDKKESDFLYCAGNSTSVTHRRWWHYSCAGFHTDNIPSEEWLCNDCQNLPDSTSSGGVSDKHIASVSPVLAESSGPLELKSSSLTEARVWRQLFHSNMVRRCMGNKSSIIGGVRAVLDLDSDDEISLLSMMWRMTLLDRHLCFTFLSLRRLFEFIATQVYQCQRQIETSLNPNDNGGVVTLRLMESELKSVRDLHVNSLPVALGGAVWEEDMTVSIRCAARSLDDIQREARCLMGILQSGSEVGLNTLELIMKSCSSTLYRPHVLYGALLLSLMSVQWSVSPSDSHDGKFTWSNPLWGQCISVLTINEFLITFPTVKSLSSRLETAIVVDVGQGELRIVVPQRCIVTGNAKKAQSTKKLYQAMVQGHLSELVDTMSDVKSKRSKNTKEPLAESRRTKGKTKKRSRETVAGMVSLKDVKKHFEKLTSVARERTTFGTEEHESSREVTVSVTSETLTTQSSLLIVQSCEKVAGVNVHSPIGGNVLQLSIQMPDASIPTVISYGDRGTTNVAPTPSVSSSLSVCADSVSPVPSSCDVPTPPVGTVSSDELLFLRAVLSLCHEEVPITVQFRSRKFVQKECSNGALSFLSFLQDHRFKWFFHPDQVTEKITKVTDDGGTVRSFVEDACDTVLTSVRKVLLPVTVHLHPSHICDTSRSENQQTISRKKQENWTPQELKVRAVRQKESDTKSASLGCLHSAVHLVDRLNSMYRTLCWNRTPEHAAPGGRAPTFQCRKNENRTTVCDVFVHHPLTSQDVTKAAAVGSFSEDSSSCSVSPQPTDTLPSSSLSLLSPSLSSSSSSSALSSSPQQPSPWAIPPVCLSEVKDKVYLTTQSCTSVVTKRKGALQAHDTRVGKGRTSSPIDSSLWEGPSGELQMSGLPVSMFRSQKSLSRVPLTVDHKTLRLVTSDRRDVVTRKDLKLNPNAVTLGQLGGSQRSTVITGISYKFVTDVRRRNLWFKGKGHYLNLRPSQPSSSTEATVGAVGVDLRPEVRLQLDFTTGEITYSPVVGQFLFHVPLSTEVMKPTETVSLSGVSEKVPFQYCTPPSLPHSLDSPEAFTSVYQKIRGSGSEQQRRYVRRLRRNITRVFRPTRHGVSVLRGTSVDCKGISMSSVSTSQSQSEPFGVQSSAGRIIWRKGLDDMPPGLRQWDPGVDIFGVPYLGVTRHADSVRHALRPAVVGPNWCASGDPNVKSFYDFYVPNTGSVVDVGRGWAQRVYAKLGRKIDRLTSEMDQEVNRQLQDIVSNQNMSIENLKLAKVVLVKSLEENDESYRKKSKSVRQVTADLSSCDFIFICVQLFSVIQKEQVKLHRVTSIFLSAFDLRVLPWLETDRLFYQQGMIHKYIMML